MEGTLKQHTGDAPGKVGRNDLWDGGKDSGASDIKPFEDEQEVLICGDL